MPAISDSVATVSRNTAGNWWTPTQSTITVDIDNAADVIVETRRGSGDSAPKAVFLGEQLTTVLRGPCSAVIQAVVGRDYRFRAMASDAAVGAFE